MYVKRTKRSAMDYFVLAMISRGGLHSLYELQQGVGLQPGGIQPVLKRLEQEGFLKRSEQQERRRRLMTVTELGERFLSAAWRDCLADYPDVESILRAATVGILMGDWERAHGYLLFIAKQHDKDVPVEPADGRQGWSSVDWYEFMRQFWEIRRRRSAADAFREIAKELEETKRC
jgi:DNA-binding MarR family transcriptional regulator